MKELISIIVPIYNIEKYLDKCILSIINQTYKSIEIILVNDGSTDNSGKICENYAIKDNRITIIKQENKGLVCARKTGIRISKGEYICFVDGDDWVEPNMCEHLYNMMMLHNVEMVQAQHRLVFEEYINSYEPCIYGRFVNDINAKNCSYNTIHRNLINDVIKVTPYLWGKLFKKSILEEFQLNIDEKIFYAEDVACTFACIPFLESIYLSDEIIYNYRQIDSSMVNNPNPNIITSFELVYQHIKNIFSKHRHSELLLKELDIFYIRTFNVILNQILPNKLSKEIKKHYYFPVQEIKDYKNIVIYGAGNVGLDYYNQFKSLDNIKNIYVVDKNKAGYKIADFTVLPVDDICSLQFDCIIIAVALESLGNEIKDELIKKYNCKDNLLWVFPWKIFINWI